jgi:hypothetical protein
LVKQARYRTLADRYLCGTCYQAWANPEAPGVDRGASGPWAVSFDAHEVDEVE